MREPKPNPVTVERHDNPPESLRSIALPIVRTPAARPLIAIILSHQICGYLTHWHRGRTRPHTTPVCEACDDQCPWRWHGYVAVYNPRTRNQALLELTAASYRALDEWQKRHESLRAAKIKCERIGQRTNGRIIVTLDNPNPPVENLPPAPDVNAILLRMWELSSTKSIHHDPLRDSNPRIRPDRPPLQNGKALHPPITP